MYIFLFAISYEDVIGTIVQWDITLYFGKIEMFNTMHFESRRKSLIKGTYVL